MRSLGKAPTIVTLKVDNDVNPDATQRYGLNDERDGECTPICSLPS